MEYTTGDILETTSQTFKLMATHYAIVFSCDGVQYVAHHPNSSHRKVVIEPLSEFLTKRKVLRVICHVDFSDEVIISRVKFLQSRREYSLLNYNCEDFIRELCNCDIDVDQRAGMWFGIAIILIVIIIIIKIR